MKDKELRGLVLKRFYDLRNSGDPVSLRDLLPLVTQDEHVQLTNVCDQLSENGLVFWKPLRTLAGVSAGVGNITARGVDVIDGDIPPPMTITLNDHSIKVSGSMGVIVGNKNSQTMSLDIGKIATAINHSNASEGEKQEAQTLLETLMGNSTLLTAIVSYFATGGSAA